ncbi:pentatricopeptide repeat-containing protein At5g10690-like isoform X1 [Zingiber officinale]|uniref:pentatricopeptide repeat-containing protein At5g10690-like isoform X1 n=1 Tax=Zingiber officinale TaxID=94328 RepID=UPI001C4CD70E|nr:pentatricopeptide repeat-containing protein At5g10690-like isoform X1 [Zingiber officinale]
MHCCALPFLAPAPPPSPAVQELTKASVWPPNLPSRCLSPPPCCSLPPASSFPTESVSRRSVKPPTKPHPSPNLRRLTSRIVELSRRRQLRQIFDEVELAKRRYGRLNTIVMNAVMEACVHCGDVGSARRVFDAMAHPDGCGVDDISFGILLKGLGEARKVDEAFEILESIEQGSATGKPQLSAHLIFGLLNSLMEAGDMRRANGLIARYNSVLREKGQSLLLYNMLIKGYARSDFPLGALAVWDEIVRQGLKPDKLTYNTLIFVCVKSGRTDAALQLLAEMKEEAEKSTCELIPDAVTYTTLLKGFGDNKDLLSVIKIVEEMKFSKVFIDRTAYTAMVDAFLACGSIKGALCIFAEIMKQAGDSNLRPKPHLYLSLMRAFALKGDLDNVQKLNIRLWSDSTGSISPSIQAEVDELLMEAAINNNQVGIAKDILSKITTKKEGFSWTSRSGMIAIKVEALLGFTGSVLSPRILPQVFVDDPVEKYMTTIEEARPLLASITLNKAIMRFSKDSAVPVVDDWGNCVGIVYRTDCKKLDAPISSMMRGPPPCVTASTSIGRAIDLLLERRYQILVVVRNTDIYQTIYSFSSRPVGVFSLENLSRLRHISSAMQEK